MNKLIKKSLIIGIIIINIIIIIVGLYFLFTYIFTKIEPFETLKGITTDLQNITIGEPKITIDNLDKTINLDIEQNTYYIGNGISESKLDYLCSNNFGFYGIENNSETIIYYYPEGATQFEKLNYNLILPKNSNNQRIINPDYKNKNTSCGGILLNVTNKTLWYYNNSLNDMENFNIDCLYYVALNQDGKPLQNSNDEIEFNCLRLPILLNLPSTTPPQITDSSIKPDAPYDTIRLMAVNDDILFAVGCHEQIRTIYYCKLTEGKPTSNDSNNWKTTQIGNISKVNEIKDIIINDNNVFIISNENKIYYNKIEFDSNNELNSNFTSIDLPIENSFYSPKFCVNNNIFYIYDNNIINNEITRDSLKQISIKWFNITNLEENIILKKIVFHSENLYPMPLNLMIYKNFLISESGMNNYIRLELYDDTLTFDEIENTKNTIHKMFNPNYDPTATTTASNTPSTTASHTQSTAASHTPSTTASTTVFHTPTTTASHTTTTTASHTTTTTASHTPTTTTSNNTVDSSGTTVPNPTEIPSGNQSPGSFVFGSAWSTGSLLNNEIENINNSDNSDNSNGIPINDINFEKLSGANMLINGKGNVGNFNDFIAKNRIFGNNLFFINKK